MIENFHSYRTVGVNPLPDMPVLGFFNSAANRDIV